MIPLLFLDARFCAYVIGVLVTLMALLMAIPLLIGLFLGEQMVGGVLRATAVTFFLGGLLSLAYYTPHPKPLQVRTAFLLTTFLWLSLAP